MIDLHCHILPAVDDGADSIDKSLKMARNAYEEGIRKILLTPHHMDEEYTNYPNSVIEKAKNLQRILDDNSIDISLRPGQEVHLNGSLLNEISNKEILFADGEGDKYIMLELPHTGVPEYTQSIIFELLVRGITPIIVHPERNKGFQNDPDKLYELVSQGCLTQITASSYLGGFGKKIKKFSEQIINSGLGHIFASDAHNLTGRRFRMSEAFEKLEKCEGKEMCRYFEDNSERVWNGKNIEIRNFSRLSSKNFIIKKIKNIFK